MSQIEQLRLSFEKMDATQKGQFINKLKEKLQGNNTNPEYTKFLNECVQKYNIETSILPESDIDDLLNDVPTKNKKSRNKNPLMGVIIGLSVVLIILLVGGGALIYNFGGFENIGFRNLNSVAGIWVSDGNPEIKLELNKNGNYQVNIYGQLHSLSGSEGATQTGIYKVNNSKLILTNDSGLSEEYSFEGNKLISDNGNIVLEKQSTLNNSKKTDNVNFEKVYKELYDEDVYDGDSDLFGTLTLANDKKSLTAYGPGYSSYKIDDINKKLGLPDYLLEDIESTRPLDGRQSEQFGNINVTWRVSVKSEIAFYEVIYKKN